MNLFSLPADTPFLDALAAAWLADAAGEPTRIAEGLILLPTRRAARALADAFLRQSAGRPLLLPRIIAFGALDEAPLALAGALDLAPAVPPMLRLAHLTRLILALDGASGAPRSAERAWPLAVELAALMDEAEREGVDLAAALPRATEGQFARHWQQTLEFLAIVTSAWPRWLAANALMNPSARGVALIEAQAEAWRRAAPETPIWAAGSAGGIPAVARLLGVVARLPRGRVVLPGFDGDVPVENGAVFPPETHPAAGMHRLLAAIGATPGDVRPWGESPWGGEPRKTARAGLAPGRAAILARALLPAGALDRWREGSVPDIPGITRLEAADEHQEAQAIALILRGALERPEGRPGARAALVTPDRDLALRVAAELARYGVIVDDSAGEALGETPPSVFLRLLASAWAEDLAPVPLLALLKHPYAAAGLATDAARDLARRLELAALRGPRPPGGIVGLRRVLAEVAEREALEDFITRIAEALAPLSRLAAGVEPVPAETLLTALIEAGEALAATDAEAGAARLWAFEEGGALAELLAEALAALAVLPPLPAASLPGLLDALLAGAVVRSRRALRGRAGTEHPRVFIWGLLEARRQSAELIVLGGLAEGVWPPSVDPGPWLSRPMRAAIGLPSPEAAIGQSAHDFVMAACGAPEVVFSCPRRRERAPVVPARWLTRLDAMLETPLRRHPAAEWAAAIDQPAGKPRPVAPPAPRPPAALRPRRLTVTEIETLFADPYAIYARHILGLKPLAPLDPPIGRADFGVIVHRALRRFCDRLPTLASTTDMAGALENEVEEALLKAAIRPALATWWRPRLRRIAHWVAGWEMARGPAPHQAAERAGEWVLPAAGGFTLAGRADRIERDAAGGIILIDFKTGRVPSEREVALGGAPQLPLEAAMAEAGAFGQEFHGPVTSLLYLHLTGGVTPGAERALFAADAATLARVVAATRVLLLDCIKAFADEATPYRANPPPPGRASWRSDYAALARQSEWQVVSPEGSDDDG